jgi:hypothetical protein
MDGIRPFVTTVAKDRPTDPADPGGDKNVSAFITTGSLTNFSAMSGAIAAAWGGLRQVSDRFDGNAVPLVLCLVFGLVSLGASTPGRRFAQWGPASFITLVNSLTLFAAVIGLSAAATAS